MPADDALAMQDGAFFMCVRHNTRPQVDGEAGVRALQLAEAVLAAMDQAPEVHSDAAPNDLPNFPPAKRWGPGLERLPGAERRA